MDFTELKRETLARHLRKHLQGEVRFDATARRANLGGMIGNNSAGSRSIVYGKTLDHVRRLDVVLSDGTRTSFGPVTAAEWERKASAQTLEGAIHRESQQIVHDNGDEIR